MNALEKSATNYLRRKYSIAVYILLLLVPASVSVAAQNQYSETLRQIDYDYEHGAFENYTSGSVSRSINEEVFVFNDISGLVLPGGLGWNSEVGVSQFYTRNLRDVLPNGRLMISVQGSLVVQSNAVSGVPNHAEKARMAATYEEWMYFTLGFTQEVNVGGFVRLASDQSTVGSLVFQKKEGPDWIDLPLISYGGNGQPEDFDFLDDLDAGEYRIGLLIDLESNTLEGTGGELRANFLIRGGAGPVWEGVWPPDTHEPVIEGYTHPLFYSFRPAPDTLSVGGMSLRDLSFAGDGKMELLLGYSLINNTSNPWSDLLVEVVSEPGDVPLEVIPYSESLPGVGLLHELRVVVDSEFVNTALSQLATGDRLRLLRGKEYITFTIPVHVIIPGAGSYPQGLYVNEGTFHPHNIYFTKFPNFNHPANLAPNSFYTSLNPWQNDPRPTSWTYPEQLWLADPRLLAGAELYEEATGISLTGELYEMWLPLTALKPNSLSQVDLDKMPPGFGYPSQGMAGFVNVADYVINGTFAYTLGENPDATETSSQADRDKRGRISLSLPIHFNRVKIKDLVDVSGNFSLSPKPVKLEFDFRGTELQSIVVESGIKADANLLVEVKAPGSNLGDPLIDKENTLVSIPLFSLPLPMGITATPVFSLKVGASADVTRQLAIPFTAGIDTTVRLGAIREGGGFVPFYEETVTPTPPQVSDPQVFDAVGADLEAWVAGELQVLLASTNLPLPVTVGPTIGAKLGGEFRLRPLSDPWWEVLGNLEVYGGVEIDILGLATLFDEKTTLATVPLFSKDAGGPLFPAFAAQNIQNEVGDVLNPGLKPLSGGHNRWFRGLRTSSADALYPNNFLVELAGGDLLQGGSATSGLGHVGRFDREGGLRWLRKTLVGTTLAPRMIDAVAEPDGGYTMISQAGFGVAIARFDAHGEPVWNRLYNPQLLNFFCTRLQRVVGEGGAVAYLVTGLSYEPSAARQKFNLSKFDETGTLLWTKRYETGQSVDTSVDAVLLASDGNLLVAGRTEFRLPEEETNPPFAGNRRGFLMKIDPSDGSILWTTVVPSGRSFSYTALTEAPDGSIYAAGALNPIITDLHGVKLLSNFTPDGRLVESIVFGRVPRQLDLLAETGNQSILTPIPHEHRRHWDEVNDMTWMDDALWLVGRKGLGKDSSAFVARFNRDFRIGRYVHFSGTGEIDTFAKVLSSEDGVVLSGGSGSLLPWPKGFETPGLGVRRMASILGRLPKEGMVRFHELTSGHQPDTTAVNPDRGTFFVYPEVMKGESVSNGGLPFQGRSHHSSTVFAPVSITTIEGTPRPTPLLAEPLEYRALEHVPFDAIRSFGDFVQWYQLDTQADGPVLDTDKDGLSDKQEFFHRGDPFSDIGVVVSANLLEGPGEPSWEVTFPRSLLARELGIEPIIQTSLDLNNWHTRFDWTMETQALNSVQEWVRILLPVQPGEEALFLRVVIP